MVKYMVLWEAWVRTDLVKLERMTLMWLSWDPKVESVSKAGSSGCWGAIESMAGKKEHHLLMSWCRRECGETLKVGRKCRLVRKQWQCFKISRCWFMNLHLCHVMDCGQYSKRGEKQQNIICRKQPSWCLIFLEYFLLI